MAADKTPLCLGRNHNGGGFTCGGVLRDEVPANAAQLLIGIQQLDTTKPAIGRYIDKEILAQADMRMKTNCH